jgi:heme-degrading monooxygenase HmoA
MILQIVRFQSALSDAKVEEMFRARSPRYRGVEGLVQKYYLRYPDTGEHGAVYVWESREAISAFRESDLGRSIANVYHIEGEKVVAEADVLLTLHADTA